MLMQWVEHTVIWANLIRIQRDCWKTRENSIYPYLIRPIAGYWQRDTCMGIHKRCIMRWCVRIRRNLSCPFSRLALCPARIMFGDRISAIRFRRQNEGRAIVVGVMDNLTKGSSGQAVQNANLMLGEEETSGLDGTTFRDNIGLR